MKGNDSHCGSRLEEEGLDLNLIVISIFIGLGVFLPIAALTIGRFLRPNVPTFQKKLTYESGNDPTGEGWVQFHIRYYPFALLFVIFDVEALFLYPWAVIYDKLRQNIGFFVLWEMLLFVLLLFLGLAYAWRKKVLEWK